MDKKDIGDRLKSFLKAQGLTQNALHVQSSAKKANSAGQGEGAVR